MATAPNVENYALGKGMLYFDRKVSGVSTGERALGNAPSFTLAVTIDKLDHYSSMARIKAKDRQVVQQVNPSIKFTLDELDPENLALLSLGAATTVTQTEENGTNHTLTVTDLIPGRYYSFAERKVGSVVLPHGTVTGGPFVKGETITQATSLATAVVVKVNAGSLVIKTVTGTFDGTHGITGGTSSATATPSAVPAFSTDVVVVKADDTVTYVAGTDYTLDATRSRIKFMGPTLVEDFDVKVYYALGTDSYTKITGLTDLTLEGTLRFVGDNPVGPSPELVIWRVALAPDGDTAFIGDDWSVLSFTGEILRDYDNHPNSPYFELSM